MKLVASNRMELLAEELRLFFHGATLDPLEPDVVIVQSKGMATWLKQHFARAQGICANVDFIYPRDFLARVFREFLDEEGADWHSWRDDRLIWRVMAVLPHHLEHPAFARVRAYLGDDLMQSDAQLRFFQLASRLAILFDRYQNYRSELVDEWTLDGGDSWTGILFHSLAKSQSAPHLPELAKTWLSKGVGAHLPKRFPRRIALFGLATMPPLHLALFENLANHRGLEMRFYHLSPSSWHWEHIRSEKEQLRELERQGRSDQDGLHYEEGHPLLASMGKVGRDFHAMLLKQGIDVGRDDFLGAPEPENHTLLSQLQSDIEGMVHRSQGDARLEAPETDSIGLHACDSPLRQIEALRGELLGRLGADETLMSQDIVVMCPDLEAYAPLIETVFDRPAGRDGRPLSYRIADQRTTSENAVARAFMALLDLMGSRFEASTVLDLLAHGPIRRAFQFKDEELERLNFWVRESGIRWGIDGSHRASFGLPSLEENTWRFGIRRLLLGTAMPASTEHRFGSILPFEAAYGLESATIGRLAEFCESLFEADAALSRPRSIAQWGRDLSPWIERLCAVYDEDMWQVLALRAHLSELTEHAQEGGFEGDVSLVVLGKALEERLCAEPSPRGFLTGGITFCRMLPMRSIPFRVVCLLGMDEDSFPRRGERWDFDLMRASPRLGDRSPRLDDRQVFLEAILSARDALIITFTGRNARDQRKLLPSVVVSELMDTLGESFSFPGASDRKPLDRAWDALCVQHALQPFSPRNFQGGGTPRSYEESYAEGARALQATESRPRPFFEEPLAPIGPTQISPETLTAFLRNPIQALLRERLALSLPEDHQRLTDREMLEGSFLDRYKLRDWILQGRLEGQPVKAIRQNMHAAGLLPPGNLGDALFATMAEEVERIAKAVRARTPPEGLKTVAVDATFGTIRIRGTIRGGGLGGIVYGHASRTGAKHRLDAWVHHVLLSYVTGRPQHSWIFGRPPSGKKKGGAWRLGHVRDPEAVLRDLTQLYAQGMEEPLLFLPKCSEALFRYPDDVSKAQAAWLGNPSIKVPGEGDHPAVRLVLGSQVPFGEATADQVIQPSSPELGFRPLAKRIFEPIWAELQEAPL